MLTDWHRFIDHKRKELEWAISEGKSKDLVNAFSNSISSAESNLVETKYQINNNIQLTLF